jgi:integrase
MKHGGARNFGYGKQLHYATKQALADCYGEGRYGTRNSHEERLRFFSRFLEKRGVSDLADISPIHIAEYAEHILALVDRGKLEVSTAQNRLSSVNVLLEFVRDDNDLRIRPSSVVGKRSRSRTCPPQGYDSEVVESLCDEIEFHGFWRVAGLVRLCRYFGLRIREASLLVISEAADQAMTEGSIHLSLGAKGGRSRRKPRCIPASPAGIRALVGLSERLPIGTNLIPRTKTFYQWNNHVHRIYRIYRDTQSLTGGPHELRTSYACDRYREISGRDAPVITSARNESCDREARLTIALELGHRRASVVSAYIGAAK